MSTLDSVARGVAAGAVGTLALDASVYRQYRRDGGTAAAESVPMSGMSR